MSNYKITPDYIDRLVRNSTIEIQTVFEKATVVSIQLPSGFVLTEMSACVDPANYNRELGVEICLERFKNKLWELSGYHLQHATYLEKTQHVWEDNI